MPPSEIILEQQRRLLASIETIEALAHKGRFGECRSLLKDFESDLVTAIEAPILLHLKARVALFHGRLKSLEATASGAIAGAVRRGRLGEAVFAPDLNELEVLVPQTTPIWWRCSQNPEHPPWQATKAQRARLRACAACLTEAGLNPDDWHQFSDNPGGGGWSDAHNHAMLWNMGGC